MPVQARIYCACCQTLVNNNVNLHSVRSSYIGRLQPKYPAVGDLNQQASCLESVKWNGGMEYWSGMEYWNDSSDTCF